MFKGGSRIICSNEVPHPNELTVSDDFNRLRIYRNMYAPQIKAENEDITIEATEEIKKEFIDIC